MNRIRLTVLFCILFATRLFAADINLPAKDAVLGGAGAVYDDTPAGKSIRSWKSTNVTARWTFDLPAKSAYRIFITYACPTGLDGSTIEVTVGSQRATALVQSTAGWGSYKEFDLGPVLLRKTGTTELEVKITHLAHRAAWDLRGVRLVPER